MCVKDYRVKILELVNYIIKWGGICIIPYKILPY